MGLGLANLKVPQVTSRFKLSQTVPLAGSAAAAALGLAAAAGQEEFQVEIRVCRVAKPGLLGRDHIGARCTRMIAVYWGLPPANVRLFMTNSLMRNL